MRSIALQLCLVLFLLATVVPAGAVDLRAPAEAAAPTFQVTDSGSDRLAITFSMPDLAVEEIDVEGLRYQMLSLTGGGLEGAPGTPGIPVITRLVALPAGAAVRASVNAAETRRHTGYRLLPVQADDAETFTIDRAAYARSSEPVEAVSVGAPGIFRDLRVVPVTFRPVSFDPVSGEIVVTERMELELDFSEADYQAETPRRRNLIPESFDRLYRDTVLNYEQSELYRNADVNVGPGTWLLIYENTSGVYARLKTVADWRARQGYNVIMVPTSTTGVSTGSIKSYIQGVYDTADPPLEFVTLGGDANGNYEVRTWNEGLSGYSGEGDHYYTTLEGGDVLSDVHLGRLSYRSLNELDTIVDKIITYETNPPLADGGWFTRAGLCGDPSSSGPATIWSNQWVKAQLLAQGYTQVDTIWSGNYPNLMTQSINQGQTVFGYRGWWGMSGFTSGSIQNLQNGDELPFAVVVTCDTGSFKSDNTCQSEAFLKGSNGGGIGAVGTATTGTHTRYNNTYYYGVWDGAINGSDHRLGVAHTRGKLELYNTYELAEPSKVEIWSVWNNLMGDPATDMYTGYPTALTVDYPSDLPPGASAVPVNVMGTGLPVSGARVSLFKDGEVSVSGYTNIAGDVLLALPGGQTAGTLLVTVTGHNLQAHLGDITLANQAIFATLANHALDDDASGSSLGDGDGNLDPGERVELSLSLLNLGGLTASGVTATLSSTDAYVTLIADDQTFADIPSGAEVYGNGPFVFELDADAPDGHVVEFELTASSGGSDWTSLLPITVQTAAFEPLSFDWSAGSALDPGETGTLSVELYNGGASPAVGISATLVSHSPWLTVTDAAGSWMDLFQTASGTNTSDPFGLEVSSATPPGHLAALSLVLSYNGMAVSEVELQYQVGTASLGDPTGPDAYGYYAFESTDTSHPQAPVYGWVEISANEGGPGSFVGLGDYGWGQDDTNTLPLPFTFRYYGVDYDEISICSNGWVAMGTTSLVQFRNYPIPGSGSVPAMISPFWDDLYQYSGNNVYYWYDSANHRYIVEWSKLRNEATNATVNVQVLLLDPAHHPTSTGDGEIIFQYEAVTNNDNTNGYATVGIQNLDRSDGLLISYWNQHPGTASNPSANRAIRFLPLDDALQARGGATPGSIELTVPLGGSIDRTLSVRSTGDEGSVLYYALDQASLPQWLSVDKSGGSIASGESEIVTLSFDATGMTGGDHEYVLPINHSGEGTTLVPITMTVITDGTASDTPPAMLSLSQNHPNPFNPKTTIRFGLPEASDVLITVFDVSGRAVKTLRDGVLPAGNHSVEWDGRDEDGKSLATGVYFYRLEADAERIQRKMLLLK